MKVTDLITADDVVIGVRAHDIADAAAQILGTTLPRHGFSPVETTRLIDAVVAREKSMPTSCGASALPHARDGRIADFVCAVGANTGGIVEQKRDPRVIITFLSPESRREEHLALLAELSRLVTTAGLLNEIAEAATPQEVISLLHR